MFVFEAAHQPAARAGDAQRVERQVLILGHPDGDRLEVVEEGGAAQVAAAGADAALDAGRVARGQLPQLDRQCRVAPRSRTSERKSTRCGAVK